KAQPFCSRVAPEDRKNYQARQLQSGVEFPCARRGELMDPVQKALWFVESHSREPISLEEIASACKVSSFHLTRAFAAGTGLSLMRYVRARRLSEAARRLAEGADDILAVALDAGYGSHEAFTRAFAGHFVLTPEQVRSQGHLNNIKVVEAIPMSATPV